MLSKMSFLMEIAEPDSPGKAKNWRPEKLIVYKSRCNLFIEKLKKLFDYKLIE